jgi:hypothetical protein
MTPFLDVPFLPDERYVEFLSSTGQIDSVHFSLPGERRLDNHIQSKLPDDQASFMELLGRLPKLKKYVLLNSRFYGPSLLTDKEEIHTLIRQLEEFAGRGLLKGFYYCDQYLLQALSDEAPDLAACLEAVPGINTMLDSQAKIDAHLAYISETCFRPPSRLILDRSLNRSLGKLAEVARWCREGLPDVQLELIANEGCLPFCPYRSSHDAYIALDNLKGGCSHEDINTNLGCVQLLKKQPYRILQSPFIRPEDIDSYLYDVDILRISGRTLGPEFLERTIRTYISRSYKGNLLDLLDTSSWLASELHIDNSALSFDFANMLSVCNNRCETCRFCIELFRSISRSTPEAAKAPVNG